MTSKSKGRDSTLPTLDTVIQALTLARNDCGITPAQMAFGSATILLTLIRDTMAHKQDYVDLGLSCANVCKALERGLDGRQLDVLSKSVLGAIDQLTMTMGEMQRRIVERGNRNAISRAFHARSEKDVITGWKQDLNGILHIFNTELVINTHMLIVDIHRRGQENTVSQPSQINVPGVLPPPPPSTCFGRDELIEQILGLAENLESIALIGPGGIGKTSIALAVLHDKRIKRRFGDDRRFIRCDQFPPSRLHFLARLSQVIGAGIDNPEDLTPLQPFLSSKEMILFLDNAESILDPQGTDAREIYTLVGELSRFGNICLGITSRVSTVPPNCKRLTIPTLSSESACDIFYSIYNIGGRSDIVNDLVRRLDFHALSISLLATTASHNMWDYDRVVKEWDTRRAQVLRTDFNESLAATIELSLASPTFHKLGSVARELLGVIAFFPQGINEVNLDWLFPTVSDRRHIFDKFCVLSLTSRTSGFTTMLAPIRNYLCPQDPESSPLLCATRDHYFRRLSVDVSPGKFGFEESRWITSEDVNVEHLLDVFTSADTAPDDVWDACDDFMRHLYWHKPRETMLRPKIEALPDDHRFKPNCLSGISRLLERVGKHEQRKQLLIHTLKLERERDKDPQIAQTLRFLSDANRLLGHHKEGIQQANEALEILRRLGDTVGEATCLVDLGHLLFNTGQLDAAEDTALRTIDLISGQDQDFIVCRSHRTLGNVYRSKGKKEKAIHHFEVALGTASAFKWQDQIFWIRYSLAGMFFDAGEFDTAQVHIEQAKSHVIGETYHLGWAMEMQAKIFFQQNKLEDARSGVLRAMVIYDRLGFSKDTEDCRAILREIEQAE